MIKDMLMKNDAMLTDFYQLTMMNGYDKCGVAGKIAVFDLFFRKTTEFSYAVAAGLDQVIDYINDIHFNDDDIDYLRSLNTFDEVFFEKLRNLHFTGDIYAVKEGTVVFPAEPILTVVAPIFEAQFIETCILTIINHQTLIATKASRMTNNTDGAILEFGLRRAQGKDAGLYGARAAIIGGCVATSNVLAGKMFGVKISGTHSHSWVMSFPDEITAFRAYANLYPDNCLLLVDTFDAVKSGIPNAIKVFDELKLRGYKPAGIRLDSGDLAYLSRYARKMLDEAGHTEAKIVASNDIDENVLIALKAQNAKIDTYGIGTKLITSYSTPSLGGVYKMAAMENDKGEIEPKIKISNTFEKITNPGFKKFVRLYNGETKLAEADLIMLNNEKIDSTKPLTIFDPLQTWKKMEFTNYYAEEMMIPIFLGGKQVYESPVLTDIAIYAKKSMKEFSEEYKRINNPHIYKVDLSQNLYDLKTGLLAKNVK